MEFRPSATLYGVRLFDGSSESRKSFAIGHCKCRQRVAGKQYGTNRIVPLVPLRNAYNADFSVQIVPLNYFSLNKLSISALYSQTAVLLIVEEDNDNPNISSIRFVQFLALLTL